ncbi:twin-arginine translocation pathway signal [Nonlabens sp. MB-3u-79]|uniref:DUF1501 domain-containing protein n=1 Tax=Nonlabens sp. MB-3u-79 TaxID=2058134 RepID=UPI000C30F4D4|nr:DUF1501 domain-containing protein [Nonlabens sp. MB-3u-79]AUC78907.1 twin-arginine translocation pathway signal [Nonlabens sp. MB-3u-79]
MCDTHKKHLDPNSPSHHEEHESWNRRTFLQALGIAGAGAFTLGGSQISSAMTSPITAALAASTNDRVLVVIRLKGGNDGLNTIVPVYDYSTYAANRASIALPQNSLYNLSPDFGLPSFMSSLQSRWGNGEMKIVHGVGYPGQNLSHFRSSDIWASTEPVAVEESGWMGRFFENEFPNFLLSPPAIPPAIQIGSLGNLAFEGLQTNYAFSVADPQQLYNLAQNGWQHDAINVPPCTYGDQLSFLRSTTNNTFQYAGVINNAYQASTTQATYGNHSIAEQFSIVARLIKGQLGTKVYMVTLDGFDTHANQAGTHADRMQKLSESIDAFYNDLAAYGNQDEVLCMTISEFGRRVEENGSNGTDHGAAAPMMLFGGGLNGNGFIGSHPSMTNLDANGNMIYSTDFRDVYSTVMKDWLCIPTSVVDQAMLNGNFNTLNLGFNCTTAGIGDFTDKDFRHFVINKPQQASLHIQLESGRKLDIRIYNMLGQEIGQLANRYFLPGVHEMNIQETLSSRISSGQYIYKIETNGQQYSSQFVMQ